MSRCLCCVMSALPCNLAARCIGGLSRSVANYCSGIRGIVIDGFGPFHSICNGSVGGEWRRWICSWDAILACDFSEIHCSINYIVKGLWAIYTIQRRGVKFMRRYSPIPRNVSYRFNSIRNLHLFSAPQWFQNIIQLPHWCVWDSLSQLWQPS